MTKPKAAVMAETGDVFNQIALTTEERAALEAWKPLKQTIDLIEQQLRNTTAALAEKRSELKPVFLEYIGLAEQKLGEMELLVACLKLLQRYVTQVKDMYQRIENEETAP